MSRIFLPEQVHKTAAEVTEPQLKRPPMYQVFMLNDDFTPMDFVVEMLMLHFHKSAEEATAIMLKIHRQGKGLCGTYPRDIAESKIHIVEKTSRNQGHPLRCVMEKVDDDPA